MMIVLRRLIAMVIIMSLASCSVLNRSERGHVADQEPLHQTLNTKYIGIQVVKKAKKSLGKRYGAGQKGPNRFDCSGFTAFVYKQFGVTLHSSSETQWQDGVQIKNRKNLRPGDLVFFNGNVIGRRIGHVGIVTEADSRTGRFYFIHAASTGVQIDYSEHEYYRVRYIGARRIFN